MLNLLFPLTTPVPTLGGDNQVQLRMQNEIHLYSFSAYLRGLTNGTFSVRLRRTLDNDTIATFSWTAAGLLFINLDPVYTLNADEVLAFDVTSTGIGASGCQITAWMLY
jgi:hypothetical protein